MTTLHVTADTDLAATHPQVKFMYLHYAALDGITQLAVKTGGSGGTTMATIGGDDAFHAYPPMYIGPNMYLDVTGTGTATVVVS